MTNEELITRINHLSNIINEKSRQSQSNYIIVSTKVAYTLQELDKIRKLQKIRKKKLIEIFSK